MNQPIDYDKALHNPSSVFVVPEDVLERSELTKEQKVEILRRWEYDASEVAVAQEEGMLRDEPLMLRRILLALAELTGGLIAEETPPTKQDGV